MYAFISSSSHLFFKIILILRTADKRLEDMHSWRKWKGDKATRTKMSPAAALGWGRQSGICAGATIEAFRKWMCAFCVFSFTSKETWTNHFLWERFLNLSRWKSFLSLEIQKFTNLITDYFPWLTDLPLWYVPLWCNWLRVILLVYHK